MTNLVISRWSYLLLRLNVYSLCNIMLDTSGRAAFAWAVFVTVSICGLPTAIIRTMCCRWLWFSLLLFWKMPPITQRWPNCSSNALSSPVLTPCLPFKRNEKKVVIKKQNHTLVPVSPRRIHRVGPMCQQASSWAKPINPVVFYS